MIIGASNSDTAIKVLAKSINDNLKKTYSHNIDSLNLCAENGGTERKIVSIASKTIAEDIEELIARLNKKDNIYLPQVIIGKSNEIVPDRLGKTAGKLKYHKALVFKGENGKTLRLRGQSFLYETPIQIVIIARSGFETTSLGLALINILQNHRKQTYDIFAKTEDATYRLKDACNIKVQSADSATFSESTVKYSGHTVIATELNVRNEYLMLTEDDSRTTKYKVQDAYGGEFYVDKSEDAPA